MLVMDGYVLGVRNVGGAPLSALAKAVPTMGEAGIEIDTIMQKLMLCYH